MTDEVEITKNCVDVLSEASELVCKFAAVSKILGIADKLTSAFPLVGAVLGLAERFLPYGKHNEILHSFEKLTTKIDQVRKGMTELDFNELEYVMLEDRIKLGMRYCLEIGKAIEKDEKMRYQERLKEVCSNQNVSLALNAIFDGMIGNGLFRSSSILDEFYKKTKGDRPKISALAARLLQLIYGGMMVIATYETLMRGKAGAMEVAKLYDSQLKEVFTKIQSVLDRCMKDFKGNMLGDINAFLGTGRSNQVLLNEIRDFMSNKYDWLENFCLVYNDLYGFDEHRFDGDRVDSLHRNGKWGIVFYRTKGDPPRFSDRFDEAKKIVVEVECAKAIDTFNSIVAKIDSRGIRWSGCAVITSNPDPDLFLDYTFSTKAAYVSGQNFTKLLLLK